MEKTKLMQKVEHRIKEDLGSFLKREYKEGYKSTYEIADIIHIDSTTICDWIKRYHIPIRTCAETRYGPSKKPSKEELEKLYLKERKNRYEISNIIGVTSPTIENWLEDYNIPIRTISEAKLKGKKKPSKEELEKWYIKEEKSAYEIAEITKTGPTSIHRWLKEYNIPIRNSSEAKLKGKKKPTKKELEILYIKKRKSVNKIVSVTEISRTQIYRLLNKYNIPIRTSAETRYGPSKKPSKEELEKLYLKERKGAYEIAKIIRVSKATISRWLKQYNIPIRSNKSRITSKSQYKSFLEQNPAAKKLSALASSANGLSGAVLDRLIQLYPNELKRSKVEIPRWIESLGKYLGPYTIPLKGNIVPSIDVLLTDLPEQIQDQDFQEILFTIVRDNYMQQFNQNPKNTLTSLEIKVKNEKQTYVRELKKQVHDYYLDVYNLEIPGIKPLRD